MVIKSFRRLLQLSACGHSGGDREIEVASLQGSDEDSKNNIKIICSEDSIEFEVGPGDRGMLGGPVVDAIVIEDAGYLNIGSEMGIIIPDEGVEGEVQEDIVEDKADWWTEHFELVDIDPPGDDTM